VAEFSRENAERIARIVPFVEHMMRNPRERRGRWGGNYFTPKLGKLDGSLAQGGSVTMSVWAGDPLADTGDDITAYDWFLKTGESLPANTKCKAEFLCGKWRVTVAEC